MDMILLAIFFLTNFVITGCTLAEESIVANILAIGSFAVSVVIGLAIFFKTYEKKSEDLFVYGGIVTVLFLIASLIFTA